MFATLYVRDVRLISRPIWRSWLQRAAARVRQIGREIRPNLATLLLAECGGVPERDDLTLTAPDQLAVAPEGSTPPPSGCERIPDRVQQTPSMGPARGPAFPGA
ncbi:unnamed protein product [Boreogadus saida]